jgi:hypothetical protein
MRVSVSSRLDHPLSLWVIFLNSYIWLVFTAPVAALSISLRACFALRVPTRAHAQEQPQVSRMWCAAWQMLHALTELKRCRHDAHPANKFPLICATHLRLCERPADANTFERTSWISCVKISRTSATPSVISVLLQAAGFRVGDHQLAHGAGGDADA